MKLLFATFAVKFSFLNRKGRKHNFVPFTVSLRVQQTFLYCLKSLKSCQGRGAIRQQDMLVNEEILDVSFQFPCVLCAFLCEPCG